MPHIPSTEKDVQDQLLSARRPRRCPGKIPYPFEYNHGMADFDIWDHMFLVNRTKNLTTHAFDTPPQVVLDLGCGGGFWALEAAKQWPTSMIIGFDIANVQPNLHDLEHHRHLAQRVKWLHGNLLDGLPFPEAQFDLVRIAYIGLGVPEDEWQSVLEEVSRVMKPGAVLEVIEEDLLFPCTTVPLEPQRAPQLHLDLSLLSFNSPPGSTPGSTHDLHSLNSDKRFLPSPLRSKLQDLARSQHASKAHPVSGVSLAADSSWNSQNSFTSTNRTLASKKHPQDHTRIKAAWDAMLSTRFLASKLLSVLPFYLSTFFDDVKAHSPYKVPLPPNSNCTAQHLLRPQRSTDSFLGLPIRRNTDPYLDLNVSNSSRRDKAGSSSLSVVYSDNTLAGPSSWSTMHLARTVNTIVASKGPISKEYEKLYTEDFDLNYIGGDTTLRQVFERDWNSWLSDMNDRMCMRDLIGTNLAWPETPGQRPDCRKWRSDFEPQKNPASKGDGPPPKLYHDPDELCRIMRIFVGKKPL